MNNHIVRGARQRWCPANMMTKKQSRLTLKIEKVQLKRIQEMSQEDLILNDRNLSENAFKAQWDEDHRDDNWASNPWVWLIDFKSEKTF